MSDNNIIEIKSVSKVFDNKTVVDDLSLPIHKGEFVTFLGPSGCGKTTTLRMIAGFERPTSGAIYLKDKAIDDIPPHLRPVNTVFQKYALFPTLDVFGNIAFGLKLKRIDEKVLDKIGNPVLDKFGNEKTKKAKLSKDVIAHKVKTALKIVGMIGYEDRDVSSLSGGQQQRVAIARAIVNQPEVLLLDEPLGALDLKMRKEMQLELKEMHQKLGITFIYVTHDQEEALTMSDTIVVMKDGLIQQVGTPTDIYNEPTNAFVASFIGESNIIDGVMNDDRVVTFDHQTFECVDKGFDKNELVDVVIRPEDIYLIDQKEGAPLSGVVTSSTFKGVHYEMWIETPSSCEFMVHDTAKWEVGSLVSMYIKPIDIHIMKKQRHTNTYVGSVVENGMIEINGYKFPCDTYQLCPDCKTDEYGAMFIEKDGVVEIVDISGKKIEVIVDFDKAEIMDNEEEGAIGGSVISIMFKGTHKLIEVMADNHEYFYIKTREDWDDGDRVGLKIKPEDFMLSFIEEGAESDEKN